MLERYLLVFFASLIFSVSSCNRAPKEASNDSAVSDSTEIGNADGDIFVTDSLRQAVNNDFEWTQPDTTSEYEADEAMVGPHTSDIDIGGFSDDGKYFVFAQTNPGDYDGGDGSVYVIDVAKNEWKGKPVPVKITREAEVTYDEFREAVKAELEKVKQKFNVSQPGETFDFINMNANNVVMINKQRYTLDLNNQNNLIELRIKGHGKDILLQKDSKLPASRGSVRRYRLNKAVVFGDKITVFVEYDGPEESGFENERYYNRKNIAITGVVK